MCTLTWRNEDKLEVFFNRDELKTRSRAHPPSVFVSKGGTRYLCPIDPDGGGTWILANENGLVLCLLNRWHQEKNKAGNKSRGQVLVELCDARNLAEIAAQLPYLCHGCGPFNLVAFADKKLAGFQWETERLKQFSPQLPLTSSSYQFETVQASRKKAFEISPNLEDFQSSRDQAATAYTTRMNRPDAQTWSRSHLQVSLHEINWHYQEEFPGLARASKLHQAKLKRKK